jgi:hypothetical protein
MSLAIAAVWFVVCADVELDVHPARVTCSADGGIAIISGPSISMPKKWNVVLFDLKTQRTKRSILIDGEDELSSAVLVANNTILSTRGFRSHWQLWDVATGAKVVDDRIPPRIYDVAEYSALGRVAMRSVNELDIFDSGEWKKLNAIVDNEEAGRRYSFNDVAFVDGGKQLVVLSGNSVRGIPHRTVILEWSSLREVHSIEHDEFIPYGVIVSDERRRMVMVEQRRYRNDFKTFLEVRRWDLSLERDLLLEDYHEVRGFLPVKFGGHMVFVGWDEWGKPKADTYVTVLSDDGEILHQWKSEFGEVGGCVDVSVPLNLIVAVDARGLLRCSPILKGK